MSDSNKDYWHRYIDFYETEFAGLECQKQADISQIDAVFHSIGSPLDLVIEDGSHYPLHQRNCLVRSIGHIRPGVLYVLEDIQTSQPLHPEFRKCKPWFKPMIGVHILLAIDHLKNLNMLSPSYSALDAGETIVAQDI